MVNFCYLCTIFYVITHIYLSFKDECNYEDSLIA